MSNEKTGIKAWKTQYKIRVQSVALALIVLGSFGLYMAIMAGLTGLAAIIFAIVAVGYGLTAWIG